MHFPSGTKDHLWQPGRQLGEKDDDRQTDQLKKHKRDDAAIDIPCRDLRGRHRLQVEEGKPEGRSEKRGLEVDRQENAEPDRVVAEVDHDGGEDRHVDEGDLDEVQEEPDQENKAHDDGQDHAMAVLMRKGAQKSPDQAIPAQAPEDKTKGGRAAQDDEHHAGQADSALHDVAEDEPC